MWVSEFLHINNFANFVVDFNKRLDCLKTFESRRLQISLKFEGILAELYLIFLMKNLNPKNICPPVTLRDGKWPSSRASLQINLRLISNC